MSAMPSQKITLILSCKCIKDSMIDLDTLHEASGSPKGNIFEC